MAAREKTTTSAATEKEPLPPAICIIPNCGKCCPATEPFCADHREDDGGHIWFLPPMIGHICCRKCGIVRRRDGQNKPCRGIVRVALRDEYTEGEAAREHSSPRQVEPPIRDEQ